MKLDGEDKEWLGSLFSRLDGKIEAVDRKADAVANRLEAKIDSLESRLDEKIERTETRLLIEFHKWASPLDQRMRAHKAQFRAIELELEALADRIAKLEGNGPN